MGPALGMPAEPRTGPGAFQARGRSRGCRWKRELPNASGADSARAGLPNFPRSSFCSRPDTPEPERSRRVSQPW